MIAMRASVCALGLLISCAHTLGAAPELFTFEHSSPDKTETRAFEARIDRPDDGTANGYSVMLIGGGSITDMDWYTPGSYERDGETVRLTILGEATRDARTIGEALVNAGFVVMRWSSIHTDDKLALKAPGMAMGIPFEYSVELTRAARDAFRARAPEARERLILLGHSLGAPRATAIADDGVVGLVLLAGAYSSRTKARPSDMCERGAEIVRPEDRDGDGAMSRREAPDHLIETFDVIDADGDGLLRDWELGALRRALEQTPDSEEEELRVGVPWPSDVIHDRRLPTLALFGGLDTMSVHGSWLQSFAMTQKLDSLIVEYWTGLGHQLSPDQGGLFGPIDPGIVERLVGWCGDVAGRAPAQP